MTTQRKFTAEEAQKKFDALPPEIKSLIYTPEVTSAIQKVGEKNHLHFDQMGVLEVETSNVMLGFTDPKDLPQILAENLRIDRVQADAVIQDLNDSLFSKIRESMKKMYESAPALVVEKKSVVMPSSASIQPPTTPPRPVVPTTAPKPVVPATPPAPVAKPTDVHAELMLREATVSMPPKIVAPAPAASAPASAPSNPTPSAPPKVEAPKPAPYKADPYREPPE